MWEGRDPHIFFSMSSVGWIAQFLGVTSGWAGVTITKFFSAILLDYQTLIALSLDKFWDRSGVVSEHVVTYIRAWSVIPTSSL
jgi:hypothetical protein